MVCTLQIDGVSQRYEGDALALVGKTYKLQRGGIDEKFHGTQRRCLYTVVDHTTVNDGKCTISIVEADDSISDSESIITLPAENKLDA